VSTTLEMDPKSRRKNWSSDRIIQMRLVSLLHPRSRTKF